MIFPLLIDYHHQHIPKRCRTPRSTISTWSGIAEVPEASSHEAPVVVILPDITCNCFNSSSGEREEATVRWTFRAWGGQLWRHDALSPRPAGTLADQFAIDLTRLGQGWECSREYQPQAIALLETRRDRLVGALLIVDGCVYDQATEPAWVVEVHHSYRCEDQVSVTVEQEPKGPYVFRLDELPAAKAWADHLIVHLGLDAGAEALATDPEAAVDIEVGQPPQVIRPDLLTRICGAASISLVRAMKVVRTLNHCDTTKLLGSLAELFDNLDQSALPDVIDVGELRCLQVALKVAHDRASGRSLTEAEEVASEVA